MWLNGWEVENLQLKYDHEDTPNLHRGAQILGRLVDWTNSNSDGWAYWHKPSRAANTLMELLHQKDRDYREDGCARAGQVVEFTDLTDAELARALRPIKAFLTRQKVEHSTILESPPPPPLVRDWRQEFVNLFTAVAACEAPEGTQVDDVLADFQAAFDETTAERSHT